LARRRTGHATGGDEAARYAARDGARRVVKRRPIGAVPPLMLKTAVYPDGARTVAAPAAPPPRRAATAALQGRTGRVRTGPADRRETETRTPITPQPSTVNSGRNRSISLFYFYACEFP